MQDRVAQEYGKIPCEEWEALRTASRAHIEMDETLREDYEIGIIDKEEGLEYYIIYKCCCDRCGIKFGSKAEAARYFELKLLRQAGEVKWFIRQPSFDLPGGIRYRADFLIVWNDGRTTVEDVKGYRTQTYILKKRQVEAIYGVEIEEVKAIAVQIRVDEDKEGLLLQIYCALERLS